MNKLIIVILATALFLLNCAHQKNLSEEEKEAYRRARQHYDWGQRSGP